MGKKIDIIYEDKETINLGDVVADMVDRGIAIYDSKAGEVKFITNVKISAGKQED